MITHILFWVIGMARRREGDELKLDIREVDGKFYAYSSTSRIVDGRKVTETTYYGRYDPVTKAITPKKARGKQRPREQVEGSRKELSVRDMLEGMSSREYRSVYLLDRVQHESRIGCDLFLSFGPDVGRAILGAAMALTLHKGAMMHVKDTMDRSTIRQMYGLQAGYSSEEMSSFVHDIGICNSNIDRFFSLRVGRTGGVISWDSTTEGTYSHNLGLG